MTLLARGRVQLAQGRIDTALPLLETAAELMGPQGIDPLFVTAALARAAA